jgi:uncharacterized OsmC-like protein
MGPGTTKGKIMTTTIENAHRNGVDTGALFTTLNAVKTHPGLAEFQFRATNHWVDGTHSRSTIDGYFGAGQELDRNGGFRFDADHPPVLTGGDHGPTPVEHLLHALAACLTAGLVNIAAARGVALTSVCSTVTGDIDLLGILGLDSSVRNGFSAIRVQFSIVGDADAGQLAALLQRSVQRSAVFDLLTNGTSIEVELVDA